MRRLREVIRDFAGLWLLVALGCGLVAHLLYWGLGLTAGLTAFFFSLVFLFIFVFSLK